MGDRPGRPQGAASFSKMNGCDHGAGAITFEKTAGFANTCPTGFGAWPRADTLTRSPSCNTGYSSVGRASDCRRLQRSDGPWFDSGWPDVMPRSRRVCRQRAARLTPGRCHARGAADLARFSVVVCESAAHPAEKEPNTRASRTFAWRSQTPTKGGLRGERGNSFQTIESKK